MMWHGVWQTEDNRTPPEGGGEEDLQRDAKRQFAANRGDNNAQFTGTRTGVRDLFKLVNIAQAQRPVSGGALTMHHQLIALAFYVQGKGYAAVRHQHVALRFSAIVEIEQLERSPVMPGVIGLLVIVAEGEQRVVAHVHRQAQEVVTLFQPAAA